MRAVLEMLRRSSGYVSGSEMARALGVSRSTINKAISSLRKLGYVIETHPKLGYRLLELDDLSLAPLYPPHVEGAKISIHYLSKCSSTQDVAEALAKEGADEGTVVVAEEQLSGRGRLRRTWYSPRGGLWYTVILRPQNVKYLHLLSLAVGVAISKAIEDITGIVPKLKWPNDLVINDRKLSGILIEARAEADRILYVLAGVGVNVNNDIPTEVREIAVSLKEVLGRNVPRVPLLRASITRIFDEYRKVIRGSVSSVIEEWKSRSCTIGRKVRVKLIDGSVIEGYARDLDRVGRLLVDDGSKIIAIDAGDVEHLR